MSQRRILAGSGIICPNLRSCGENSSYKFGKKLIVGVNNVRTNIRVQ